MKHLLSLLFCFVLATTAFSQYPDTTITYEWKNNLWQPLTKNISSYDASCRVTSILTQDWNANSSTWEDTTLSTITYNGNNQWEQILTQAWNPNINIWEDFLRQTYSYNNDNLVKSVLMEIYQSNSWKNLSKTTYTYNADNTIDVVLIQIWAGSWINSARTTYTYNADKTINYTITEIYIFGWSNASKDIYAYNAQGKISTVTKQTWQNNQWKDSQLETYTYDGNGNLTEVLYQNWDDSISTWVDNLKTEYFYISACSLPLTLLDFTATLNGKAAQLQWTTVTEINTKNFVVQRSTDGVHFTNIGTVNAAGNSTQKITYQFSDGNALNAGSNNVYYRLQMTDNDGKFTYSKIARVTVTPSGKLFVVYPNPVKDKLIVRSSISLNKTEVRITDATGKVVQKQQLESVQAGVQNTINVAGLNKGVYYLQFITGSDIQTVKFFKY